jgi:hypothetical protein
LATRDGLAGPEYVSEIVGGGASINVISYDSSPSFSSIEFGGAEITIKALRGEVYALDCLADVNGDPNATIYYKRTASTTGLFYQEQWVALKNYHFVALVQREYERGDLRILVRPFPYILPAPELEPSSSEIDLVEVSRRLRLTDAQRAAEDAAKAAAAAKKAATPIPKYTMKLWGCQVSSAQ